jgi:hypothetical protein
MDIFIEVLVLWQVCFVITVIYLLPGIIASARSHRSAISIWIITIFTGWTVVGWLVALVWAFSSNVKSSKYS